MSPRPPLFGTSALQPCGCANSCPMAVPSEPLGSLLEVSSENHAEVVRRQVGKGMAPTVGLGPLRVGGVGHENGDAVVAKVRGEAAPVGRNVVPVTHVVNGVAGKRAIEFDEM